jgi:chitin disaccharide deacetylase
MLIVNADDLGRNRHATDAILACHAKRRITSTSAMVFMEDSDRAAALAREQGIDVGLHINFSERFSADAVPERLRERHDRICGFLMRNKYALLLYHPGLCGHFRSVFEAQHAEFVRLYGRQPSHLDGHQHKHLASNVLLQRILPEGTKVRRSFSFSAGEKSLFNRIYRSVVDRSLARRHRLTDYFFALPHHMAPARFERVLDLARQASVELMVHPEIEREYDYLMSDDYGRAVSRVRLAGYDAL